jgi:hypothetical protein
MMEVTQCDGPMDMATRKADVADLIAMKCSLDAAKRARINPPDVSARLLELAHDESAHVRLWVVQELSDGAPVAHRGDVIEKLRMLSDDCDERVRAVARKAIGIFRMAQTAEA